MYVFISLLMRPQLYICYTQNFQRQKLRPVLLFLRALIQRASKSTGMRWDQNAGKPMTITPGRLDFIFIADMQDEYWLRGGLTKKLLKSLLNWKGYIWPVAREHSENVGS